jgi:hypothetical protein
MRRDEDMAHAFSTKLAVAAAALSAALFAAVAAADLGGVQLDAGGMQIMLGRTVDGLTIDIAPQPCSGACGFDVTLAPAR